MKKSPGKRRFSAMDKRRKFDKEFKQEAVQLALSRGGPLREVAEGLGVRENLLGRWVREYRENATQAFPGNGRLKASDEEMRQLRKENAELKVENAILKKVAAIFSRAQK
jgi:transposase